MEQAPDGMINLVTPKLFGTGTASGWGDATTICPTEIYNSYGDIQILRDQFESMSRWIEYVKNTGDNPYLWNTGFHYGDWLGLDAKEDSYEGITDKFLIATAYYAHSTELTANAAKILGYKEKYEYFAQLFENIRNSFMKEYLNPDGTVIENTQTADSIVLAFHLTNNPKSVADDLARLVKENNTKITTGFLGTPYISYALSQNGYAELAYDLLLQKEFPSWLYPITKGATTIWEHWDGIKPDGSFWSADMNSFNHYAYGAISAWIFTEITGINYDEPGYKTSIIAPKVNKKLSYARASVDTMYGKIASSWEIRDKLVHFKIVVPANTKCTFRYSGIERVYNSGAYEFDEQYEDA